MKYVLLSTDAEAVTVEFAGPQPVTDDKPGYAEIEDSDPRYLAWLSPPLTVDQVLAEKIAAGIAITSTGTPALNATYALDPTSTAQIYQIGVYANQFGVFPSGNATQAYPDKDGVPHTFTIAEFVAFLRAVAPLVSALETQAGIMAQGGTPTWPAQTATIA